MASSSSAATVERVPGSDADCVGRTRGEPFTPDLVGMAYGLVSGDVRQPRLLGQDFGANGIEKLQRVLQLAQFLPAPDRTDAASAVVRGDPAAIFGRALYESLDAMGAGPRQAAEALGVPVRMVPALVDGDVRRRAPSVGAFVLGVFEGVTGRTYAQALEAASGEGWLTEDGTYPAMLAMRFSHRVRESGMGGRIVALTLPGFGRIIVR